MKPDPVVLIGLGVACLGISYTQLNPEAQKMIATKAEIAERQTAAEIEATYQQLAEETQGNRANCTPVNVQIVDGGAFDFPPGSCITNGTVTAAINHEGVATNLVGVE